MNKKQLAILAVVSGLIVCGLFMYFFRTRMNKIVLILLPRMELTSLVLVILVISFSGDKMNRPNSSVPIQRLFNRSLARQVIFSKEEILKDDGEPYTVFTPYSKKWLATLNDFYLRPYPTKEYGENFYNQSPHPIPSLTDIGFEKVGKPFPSQEIDYELIRNYKQTRDYPGDAGTSRLSVHLRFGTISVRALASTAKKLSGTYLNELIWRDFYHMVLWHFPQVRKGKAFRPEMDNIRWRNNEKEFEAWCEGRTGYPIVDAGMRELNETGFMHNRVRMITASFLAKHLLVDWRWGEAYFAKKLLDYDYAANNGGWQWAAGTGTDAMPYFRIFNPSLQAKKFDKDLQYIRKWIPEIDSFDYPRPFVEHEFARKRALEEYTKVAKGK